MAYTEIHKITATLDAALKYISSDKVEEISKDIENRIVKVEEIKIAKCLRESLKDSLDYAVSDKEDLITFKTYTSFNCCFPLGEQQPGDCIINHSARWSKAKAHDRNRKLTKDMREVVAWHLIQSFEETVKPEVANEIGRKLVDKILPNFPAQISTHTNTVHTHNHIIFSAWDIDGKKYNGSNKNYNLIREVSDKLCQEYGLHIMENTQEMKLIRYKDADGKIHYFEPTDRKIDLIRKRENNDISSDNVNSYRNTESYTEKTKKKNSLREKVRNDIDYYLNDVTCFESLIQRLREQGYVIKDKRKNGGWLKYITYIPPMAEKGVRDYTLSEDGRYTREKLEIIIAERVRNQREDSVIGELKYFDTYKVGEVKASDLDEEKRIVKSHEFGTYVIRRSVVETEIIKDLKKDFSEIERKFGINYIHELAAKTKDNRTAHEKELLDSIQFRFDCLKFIETRELRDFESIRIRVERIRNQLGELNNSIDAFSNGISKDKMILEYPKEIEKIMEKISKCKSDEGYMSIEYGTDVKRLKELKRVLQSKGLVSSDKLSKFGDRIRVSEKKLEGYKQIAYKVEAELNEYKLFEGYLDTMGYNYNQRKEPEKSVEYTSDKEDRVL